MTDTEATASDTEAGPTRRDLTPGEAAERHAARTLARALVKLERGTKEEQKARWTERKGKYTGDARKLIHALVKDGISFQLDETQTGKARRTDRKAQEEAAAAGTETQAGEE